MAGRLGLIALALLAIARPSHAEDFAPLVVVSTPEGAKDAALSTLRALDRYATEHGTAVIDLTPAPPAAPQASENLRHGVEDYQAFEFVKALARLDAGLAEAARTGALGLTPSELSDLLIFRALVLTELGDATRAWDDFVRAAVIDPSRRLDAARFPPRATEPFARAQSLVGEASGSMVTLEVPGHCRAFLDARPVTAGQAQAVKRGEHYVRVECAARQPLGELVTINEPARTVAPTLSEPTRPSQADALAVARRQGARKLVWAELTLPDGRSPTLALVLLEVSSGSPVRGVTVRAGPGRENAIAAAVSGLVAAPGLRGLGGEPARRPWYSKPWLWGVVGVSVATAILLPFALDSASPAHFDLRLRGDLPP